MAQWPIEFGLAKPIQNIHLAMMMQSFRALALIVLAVDRSELCTQVLQEQQSVAKNNKDAD